MAIKEVDIFKLGELLGYNHGEVCSIKDIRIGDGEVVVTRFVQDPDKTEPRRLVPMEATDLDGNAYQVSRDGRRLSALIIDERFSYRPKGHQAIKPTPVYVRLSRPVITVLKRLQWGV